MDLIALSKGKFDGQSWVDPDRTAVPDEEIASGPISGYCGGFFLGEVSGAFVWSEVGCSAGGCGGTGCGACGRWRRGRGWLWGRVSEGVVVVVRRLGEGWVDRGVWQWRSELVYRLWGDDSCTKRRVVLVNWMLAEIGEGSPGGCSLLSGSGYAQVAPNPRFKQLWNVYCSRLKQWVDRGRLTWQGRTSLHLVLPAWHVAQALLTDGPSKRGGRKR